MEDLSNCPNCGGVADNGLDNCVPQSAFMCSKCCAQEDVEKADAASYARGESLAKDWIKNGGDLNADGPDTKDEAFYNGFIDTLAEERRARQESSLKQ